jgi:hypothetical protein
VLALAPPVETTPNIFFAPDDELLRSLAERSLRRYVVQAWHVAEPSTPYVSGWHIDCICEHLEQPHHQHSPKAHQVLNRVGVVANLALDYAAGDAAALYLLRREPGYP